MSTEPVTGVAPPEPTEELAEELIERLQVPRNRDLVRRLVFSAVRLASGDADRLDLKIAATALTEMGDAFKMFAAYHETPKVTLFGSARTSPSDRLYELAKELATRMARAGWMVVTGAGPGIMAAGNEGAGREMTIGVNIRLPFEAEPNEWIASDEKLVDMKYFFTRKLMLMKESTGFCCLPGGFGTLDEAFELLTLLQTGKAEPAPIVLLDTEGGSYWRGWERFVRDEVYGQQMADWTDAHLYLITDSVDEAIAELLRFHRNYHSRRFVGRTMVIRLRHAPTPEQIESLSSSFADICSEKGIWATPPLSAERTGGDHLELPRIAMEFDRTHHGRLRQLIDALNDLVPAELPTLPPPAGVTGTFTGGEGATEER